MSTAVIGVFLRAASWCLSFAMLCQRRRTHLRADRVGQCRCLLLALSVTGYRYGGNTGLGWAYVGWYAVYMAIVYAVYRYRYGMKIGRGLPALLASALAVGAGALWLRECRRTVDYACPDTPVASAPFTAPASEASARRLTGFYSR